MTKAKSSALEPRKRFAPGKRRLTAAQFDSIRPHLGRISQERIEAARLTLVDDVPMAAIAKHFGWSSRQAVSDAVNSVFAARARLEEVQLSAGATGASTPAGWERVTLIAPPALITRWRKEVANQLGKIQAAAHKTQVEAEQRPRRRQATIAAAAAALGEPPFKPKASKEASRPSRIPD